MTFPRVTSDLLILLPSLSRTPVAPVASALSLPARSTRWILLIVSLGISASNLAWVEGNNNKMYDIILLTLLSSKSILHLFWWHSGFLSWISSCKSTFYGNNTRRYRCRYICNALQSPVWSWWWRWRVSGYLRRSCRCWPSCGWCFLPPSAPPHHYSSARGASTGLKSKRKCW